MSCGSRTAEAGYSSPAYAASLSDLGVPVALPRSGGWLIERAIPGAPERDAMGCYPLFTCPDWSGLADDLDELAGRLVSVTVVTDPFAPADEALFRTCFSHVARFKEHFVVDLAAGPAGPAGPSRPAASASASHRRHLRRALASVRAEEMDDPADLGADWLRLYAALVARHRIRGIADFPPSALLAQLEVPGMLAVRAVDEEGASVAAALWCVAGEVAYYHLGASSEEGYRASASYAVFAHSLDRLAERGVSRVSLGAAAGSDARTDDGLSRFKRGWATATAPVYVCGRVLDPDGYDRLARRVGDAKPGYFPAYRAGEFP